MASCRASQCGLCCYDLLDIIYHNGIIIGTEIAESGVVDEERQETRPGLG